MLDIATYRHTETAAKNELTRWQVRARHSVDAFEKIGFPVRVDTFGQLRSLMDTMSESRFDRFMEAMGGLDKDELKLFVDVAVSSIRFNEFLFSNQRPILALDNLMQAMLFYVLVNRLGNFTSLLELGCGSGFISFFMAQKKDLALYVQTEVCESFYLLQSAISSFLFSGRFYEAAMPGGKELNQWSATKSGITELNIPKQDHKAAHYPWWRLGELANNDKQFDIVASNANLLEFSRAALLDYLPLIQKKLKDDGLFVFHCTGSPANGTVESLLKDLYSHKFAPLLYANEFVLDKKEDFETKKIVIAPAGYAVNQLLDDDDFTSMFDEIVLLDDAKGGGELKGRKILSRDELAKTGIKEGVVFHDNPSVVKVFSELFHSIGIKTVDAKLKDIGRSFAVFVGEKHPLFEKYYDLKNFKRYFNSKEDCVANLFSFDCKERKLYSKLDISDFITKSCQK